MSVALVSESATMAELRQLYPGRLGLCLIRLQSGEKRPLDASWNRAAAQRYHKNGDPGGHLEMIASHFESGGNIGWAIPDGVLVIDADSAKSAAWLEERLPTAPRQETLKGAHFVVRAPLGRRIKAAVGLALNPGVVVDLRTAGASQIAAAPSVHPSGLIYEWKRELPLDLNQLPELPKAIDEAIVSGSEKQSATVVSFNESGGVGEGRRNSFLTAEAGKLFNASYTGERLFAALNGINELLCKPPLAMSEVRSIVESAAKSWKVGDDHEWEAPIDFRSAPLDDFPVAVLPEDIRDAVGSVATALGNSPAMAAQVALGALSFAASRTATVAINPTYIVPTNLYMAVIAEPGAGKSPTLAPLTEPLRAWKKDLTADIGPSVREGQARWDAHRKATDSDIEKATKSQGGDRDRMIDEAARRKGDHESRPRPELPIYITGDFTEAALARVLAVSNERAIAINDEGATLFQSLSGRFSKSSQPEAALFASCWSGSAHDEHRIGRDGASLRQPLLSVITMIQPGVLRRVGNIAALREQGVLDRFCWTVSDAGGVPANPPPMDPEALWRYRELLFRILKIPPPNEMTKGFRLQLSTDAINERTRFVDELTARCFQGGDLEGLSGFVSKLRSNVERLAGVLHLAKHPSAFAPEIQISGDTWADSNSVGRYWLSHGVHVFDLVSQRPGVRQAKLILGHLERLDGSEAEVGRNDLLRRCAHSSRGAIQNRDDFALGLELLQQHGYVRETRKERKRLVDVNPKWRRG